MFLAASFTIAKTWKQLKCLLAVNWVKKKYTYNLKKPNSEIEQHGGCQRLSGWEIG